MRSLAPVLTLLVGSTVAAAADLPRSDPEAQGVSSPAVLDFIRAADEIDAMHSVMIVRHGQVVAEGWWTPYDAASPHMLYSLSKSFTSTAVGLAAAEGKLSIDDDVLKFFPREAPAEASKNLKAMRVSDLLRMSTGHQVEPTRPRDEPWSRHFLAQPVPFKPGTHFLYNTSATYMLSAIVQRQTGQTVLDYLRPRLFEPLGIDHPTWEASPEGVSTGGYGLSVRTEDIAKFGQLYLQKGKWQGRQLVPEAWVERATARQTSNGSSPTSDWDQGYGYQFWRCRHGAYRGDGAFGQYIVVLPEQDAVVVITSGVKDMQATLDLVWDRLLPAFRPSPLPADPAARDALRTRLESLAVKIPEPAGRPGAGDGRVFKFPANDRKVEAVALDRAADAPATLRLTVAGKEYALACERTWQKGRLAFLPQLAEQPASSSGTWVADDTFRAKVCFTETPFYLTIDLKFADGQVTLDAQPNVGNPARPLHLVGRP